MRTRPATKEDFERLRELHKLAGFDFPMPDLDSPLMESIEVVENEQGEILMAAVAQRTVELTLLMPRKGLHPVVKMEGIRLLHSAIRDMIAPKGYTEGFAFLPPEIEKSYGRHLRKWFGWARTWVAYRVLDWKGEKIA